MKIKPNSDGDWYYISRAHNPDKDETMWRNGSGEFSISSEDRFNRHLKRYNILNKFYAKLNGTRLKAILKQEAFFFGIRGMEKLVYK